jgi:mono/diheme cytochrome c family protein
MKKHILLIPAFLALAACNGGPNQTNIELVTNMMDQPAIKSQGWNHKDDTVQMRMPPDHTISRGNPPYRYANDPAGAEKQPNPLAGNMSAETLTLGQKTFEIYCALCHGATGAGDGRIAPHMSVKPRNLLSAEAKAYPDGRIFHAITNGKGVMGSYASQITDANRRWAVVNYVRTLQKQAK